MSRKYKQSGYMEAGHKDDGRPGQRRSGGPRQEPLGPRGRGLGAPKATAFRCAQCGHPQALGAEADQPVALDAACGECRADIHTCTHCAHFDTSATFECRERIPLRIGKKDRRNECELFKPKLTQGFAADAESPPDARTAFDDLFNL